jgi:hypothetical protein
MDSVVLPTTSQATREVVLTRLIEALLSFVFGFDGARSQYQVDFPKILLLIASGFTGVPLGAVYELPIS